MRILHIITSADAGGAQRVVIDLCACSVADGNTVAVASMPHGPMWQQLPPSVRQYALFHMKKSISPADELKCLRELKAVIRDFSPDIIHLHCSKAGLLGRLAAGRLRRQTIYTMHGFDQIRKAHKKFLPLERLFKNWCAAIVAVSEYDVRNMADCGIKKNVILIPNAVADTPASPSAFPTEKKTVLCIARLAAPKRLDIFERAAVLLKTEFLRDDLAFVWIGGATDSSLARQLEAAKTDGTVLFAGEIPDAAGQLANAALFVLFSDNEGLPMTVLEALAKGIPVVASKVGGIPELVDETNGALVNMDGPAEEIARAAAGHINRITSEANRPLYKKMCAASRKKYEEKYTLGTMYQRYRALYEKTAGQNKSHSTNTESSTP